MHGAVGDEAITRRQPETAAYNHHEPQHHEIPVVTNPLFEFVLDSVGEKRRDIVVEEIPVWRHLIHAEKEFAFCERGAYKAVSTRAGKKAMPLAAEDRPASSRLTIQGRPDVVLKEVGMLMRTMLTEEKEGMNVKAVKANIVSDGP